MGSNLIRAAFAVFLFACVVPRGAGSPDGDTAKIAMPIGNGPHYATCKEVAEGFSNITNNEAYLNVFEQIADGEVTLYIDHDPNKPWIAWCAHMGYEPKEYLTLRADSNYSQFADNYGAVVRASFHKVRIDPITLKIYAWDWTFSRFNGEANYNCMDNRNTIYGISYGAAGGCDGMYVPGLIDLRGTPFRVSPDTIYEGGIGFVTYSKYYQVVELTTDGEQGWISPIYDRLPLDYDIQLLNVEPDPNEDKHRLNLTQ